MDVTLNAARFTGFADVYGSARPALPAYPARVIARSLGRRPQLVVDLGCGPGLSTMVWKEYAGRAIGVEPNADMLAAAREKAAENLSFVRGYGHATGLEAACADAVVCSQSFHWMEPGPTLAEVNRILKPGGVFATVDYDWPPLTAWPADSACERLDAKVRALEGELPAVRASFVRFEKARHLQNMRESGYFRYVREVLFSNTEPCTAQRYAALLMSQGSVQAIMNAQPELLREDIAAFERTVAAAFGGESVEAEFSYRMRLGVK